MRRTPLWVPVAAIGLQIAALGLCVWAIENAGRSKRIGASEAPKELPPARKARVPAPLPLPGATRTARVPAFIADAGDGTRILGGSTSKGPLAVGIAADGNIRIVDVDDAKYAGQADATRARMREVGGTRAFTIHIRAATDDRLQVTFTGGLHDAETLSLEPLVRWSDS